MRAHVHVPAAARTASAGRSAAFALPALTAALGSLLTDPRGRVVHLTKYTETLAAGPRRSDIDRARDPERKVRYSLRRAWRANFTRASISVASVSAVAVGIGSSWPMVPSLSTHVISIQPAS